MSADEIRERYLERAESRRAELPGAGLAWLEALRREARAQLAERGFPTRRDEDWRWTDVSGLVTTWLEPAPPRLEIGAFPGGADGVSGIAGVRLESLREALERDPGGLEAALGQALEAKGDGFAALNGALFEDGALVEIEPGASPALPVWIRLESDAGKSAHPRCVIRAGAGSRAVLIEDHAGAGGLQNAVTEVFLEPGAELEHVRLQRHSEDAHHVATLAVHQAADSRYSSWSLAWGARLGRVDLRVLLAGEGAECALYGLYLARGSQLLDHHTLIDHATPHTVSRELYKGILDGRARGVFRGRVHVRPHAQQISAEQTNRNLLLSDDAVANSKPQLEIYADEVRCSHGATIGQLPEQEIFYLRSRGITRAEARALLTYGFAREILEKLPSPALRRELEDLALAWLPRARPGRSTA